MWISAQATHPIWYFDATGCVIEKIKGQNDPFLYSIVFHDKKQKFIFPLAEFISTGHDSQTISSYLSILKYQLEKTIPLSNQFQFAPIIVTDFSWALINSIMKVFNNCSIDYYTQWCYEILFNVEESFHKLNIMKVISYICATHFLKLLIEKVRKIKTHKTKYQNDKLQNLCIFSFTLLQNATTIKELSENLKHIYNVFSLQYVSEQHVVSFSRIKTKLKFRDNTTQDEVIQAESELHKQVNQVNQKKKTKKAVLIDNDPFSKSLKKKSPSL